MDEKLHNLNILKDDTTVYKIFDTREKPLNETINVFLEELGPLLFWCKYNRMDINWSKTYLMFVSWKRKVKAPDSILIELSSSQNMAG